MAVKILFYRIFFMRFSSVRGEGPKSPKSGFLKMSRKRVFLVFLKVQGPRFSCKPNIAFFMGYPLYRGWGKQKKPVEEKIDVSLFFLRRVLFCFVVIFTAGGFGESGPDSPSLSGT